MSETEETTLVLSQAISILEGLQCRYFVCGSIASGARGEFRATNDIDIVCEISPKLLTDFISSTKKNFYADEESIPEAVRTRSSFNIIHRETFIKVDFFTKLGALEVEEFSRATPLLPTEHGSKAFVASSEYSIISKLRWWKNSGQVSDRQLRDIRGVIGANPESLDKEYLHYWGNELNLSEPLNSLLSEDYDSTE